jgi:hypothetical protein
MDIRTASRTFEQWLKLQTQTVASDLRHKRTAMVADPFCFLRATYYRWAEQFLELHPDVSQAPTVLAVGDLHLENFGTWRDGIGRLAWGINDFDEAYPLPFTNDLVRTATSAFLAVEQNHLRLKPKSACNAILEGYREGIASGGRPFVIGEAHRWFKPILQSPQRDPGLFWDKLRGLPLEKSPLPPLAKASIIAMLPDPSLAFELRHRIAGLGNLGKPRYTAIANWLGGPVAREAKAVTLSAAGWAQSKSDGPYYAQIIASAIRSVDPYLKAQGSWVTRRLSPDCRRLELASLTRVKDEEWLLHAMGFETANVHLGTKHAARSIARHLKDAPKGWLKESASVMQEKVVEDLRRFEKSLTR